MMQNNQVKSLNIIRLIHKVCISNCFLIYDIFMVFLIIFNLFCLCANFFLSHEQYRWMVFHAIHLESVLASIVTFASVGHHHRSLVYSVLDY